MKNPFKDLKFERSCFEAKDFFDPRLPEIVIVGKSNVGKSSLINHLCEQKNLAKTSSKPGKTQSINFFSIENKLFLVDLPGYGYAKISKKEREKFKVLVDEYFQRTSVKLVLFLVDSRHAPTELDKQMFDYFHFFGFPVLVILTKADKLKTNEKQKAQNQIKTLFALKEVPILYSINETQGKQTLLGTLNELL